MVLGVGGSNGAIIGSIKSKMAADGHLGMTALSRVTGNVPCVSWAFLLVCSHYVASARASCMHVRKLCSHASTRQEIGATMVAHDFDERVFYWRTDDRTEPRFSN